MKTYSLLAAVFALGLTLATGDADAARRLGGGKSSGMQRQVASPDKSPSAAPTATKSQPAAATPQAQPRRSWMGPLAGLAAGLGLAALASHLGMGEQFASMLMIGLLAVGVLIAISYFMRRRGAAAHQPHTAGMAGMQYAAASTDSAPANRGAYELSMPGSSSGEPANDSAIAPIAATGNIPADFDVAGCVRNAKVSFIRLQAANDAGNLDDIRAFTSPEMFAEIKMDIVERGCTTQETDVVNLDADLIDVTEEASHYLASVRFSGLIREERNAAPEPFAEIWHISRPRDGSSGWVLTGIQQQ